MPESRGRSNYYFHWGEHGTTCEVNRKPMYFIASENVMAQPKKSDCSPRDVLMQSGTPGLRFQMFRDTGNLRLRFPTFRNLRCSRATPVQRIACRIRRRRSGLTFSDVSAPPMLSRDACAAKPFQDMISRPWSEICCVENAKVL